DELRQAAATSVKPGAPKPTSDAPPRACPSAPSPACQSLVSDGTHLNSLQKTDRPTRAGGWSTGLAWPAYPPSGETAGRLSFSGIGRWPDRRPMMQNTLPRASWRITPLLEKWRREHPLLGDGKQSIACLKPSDAIAYG